MINNDYRLIGTIVTDFEDDTKNEKFPKKKFLLEVETKSKYGARQYPLTVIDGNRNIDVSKSYKGCKVIVNGYIDCFKEYLSLVAQDIYLLSGESSVVADKSNDEKPVSEDLPF